MHVVVVADDVDPFAGQFVDDVLDAVAADADAGPDAIDPLVGAADGHFGAVAGLAGNGTDFDHALGDFGDFLLEKPQDQVRLGAAEDDLHPAAGLLHFVDRRAHALVGMMRFAGDLFALGQYRLDVGQRDGGGAAFVALNDAGDQLPAQLFVFVVQGVPLGLANLLDHHLLGGLGADALGDFGGVHRHAIVAAANRTGGAINHDDDVGFFPVVLLGGGNQGRFDPLEDDLFVDILIAMDRIDDT